MPPWYAGGAGARMASSRLHPVHLNCVAPRALLVPLDRAPSLAGRDRVLCAVEVIDCRASLQQFRQGAQLCATTRLRQTSSSINCALRRVAAIPTIYEALPPHHHQLHRDASLTGALQPLRPSISQAALRQDKLQSLAALPWTLPDAARPATGFPLLSTPQHTTQLLPQTPTCRTAYRSPLGSERGER